MTTVGIVSPGAMGSALGRVWAAGGADVVTTVAGRSARTRSLAEGLRLVDDLDAVVGQSDIVVSVCPPAAAASVLSDVLEAAATTGRKPLLADLNAVSPMLVRELAARASAQGLSLVDGGISGGPPQPSGDTTLYLAGPGAERVAALEAEGLRSRVVGELVGHASAVKMCTASVYKGTTALWAQALQTAHHHGVVDIVLDDLRDAFPETAARAARLIALATSKSGRFVAEMEQIAATQEQAGAGPELFEGMAAAYRRLSTTSLADLTPEQARDLVDLTEVLHRLR